MNPDNPSFRTPEEMRRAEEFVHMERELAIMKSRASQFESTLLATIAERDKACAELARLREQGFRVEPIANRETPSKVISERELKMESALGRIAALGIYCCDTEGLGHECEAVKLAMEAREKP